MINKETVCLFMLGKEVSLDLVFLANVKFLLVSWVFSDAPLSRFMGALLWGRVIVLLSRGPPSEVNVYFCAVTCVF